MQQDFEKFKKRVWIHILISSAIIAVMTGFFAVVAVLLPCRLFGIEILWLVYVLIALGGMALGGGVALLIFRTNDKKIARRLDEELELKERTVTALVFGECEGEMYDAQREDAAKSLARYPAKSLKYKNLLATAICAVLAVVMIVSVFVVGIAVPPVFAEAEPQDVDKSEPPRQVTDWEWTALDDLIEYVEKSKKLDETTRADILAQLSNLRNVLLDGIPQSRFEAFVDSAVVNIRNAVRVNNESLSDAQKTANTEESEYVISRLYEIFEITSSIEPDDDGGDDNNNGSDDNSGNNGEGGGTGAGGLNISDIPFFDRELGDVKCGEVRDEYYERALQALEEGLLTDEEWKAIMATYFSDLNDKNE